MKRHYSISQLNAISRSYTEKARESAIRDLIDYYSVDYNEWCRKFGYKGSPVALLTSIRDKKKATIEKLQRYRYDD